MLHVVCIKAGTAFGPDYPNILFDMVRRNLPEGFKGKFVCFTDDAAGLDEGIEARPLPHDLPGWWSKLALFKPGLFNEGDRIVFLDLDTVITGRIDELCSYAGPFAILRDAFWPKGLQSAVMAWGAGECEEIWQSYLDAGCPTEDPFGDQAWIERSQLETAVRLQDAIPGFFVSYKQLQGLPVKESVVVFHGTPRPHEVTQGWVPLVWKMGGITRADLVSICNTDTERLTKNVRSAIDRLIPWLKLQEPHAGHVAIIGGGPSMADKFGEIAWRKSMGQQVWALNGTASYLRERGIIPDAHVIVDARPENAAFLDGAASDTMHYLASQCDPEVFKAAERVTLWHAHSPGMVEMLTGLQETSLVGGGSTVGLQALVIAYILGYRKIHLYGFDSSYREDEHHAYPQGLNANEVTVNALVGDRTFKAAPWMVQQAEEFMTTAAELERDGTVITVHGDGLLPYMANELPRPMTPAQVRAAEVLSRLGPGSVIGAEIGVFVGDMSAALMERKDLFLFMVDSWEGAGAAYTGDSGDFHAGLTQAQQDSYRAKAEKRTPEGRRKILAMRSGEAVKLITDHSLDFVFIDADHSYEGAKADIRAWRKKVKPGGLLCGHDYENAAFPKFGVTQAVKEFSEETGMSFEVGQNFTWFMRVSSYHNSTEGEPVCP
jgi:uncharacterized Rossmann fold enzyme